jgi:hypothetical protein
LILTEWKVLSSSTCALLSSKIRFVSAMFRPVFGFILKLHLSVPPSLSPNPLQDLGLEFLKYVKKNKARALTPFTLACMLSMARIHRFEDMVRQASLGLSVIVPVHAVHITFIGTRNYKYTHRYTCRIITCLPISLSCCRCWNY